MPVIQSQLDPHSESFDGFHRAYLPDVLKPADPKGEE